MSLVDRRCSLIEIVEVNPKENGAPLYRDLRGLIRDASRRLQFVGVTVAVGLRGMRTLAEADMLSSSLTEELRRLCGKRTVRIVVHFASREAVVYQNGKVVAAIGVKGPARCIYYRSGVAELPLFRGTCAA
ncbi:MAG: hypothetical protein O3B64_03560 [bacterium]|nr:hypothetical protein [bacterium]